MKFYFIIFFVFIKIIIIFVKFIDVFRVVYYSYFIVWGVFSISFRGVNIISVCVVRVIQRGWGIGYIKVSFKVKYIIRWNVEGYYGNIVESCRVFEFVVVFLLLFLVQYINERMNGKENWVIGFFSGSYVFIYVAVEVVDVVFQIYVYFRVVIIGQG